jgi:ketopantoate reductase
MSDNPRISVIGTGAIGGFYGMMLLRAPASMCIFCCEVSTASLPRAVC